MEGVERGGGRVASAQEGGGARVTGGRERLIIRYGRSLKTIDPRIPTMPGRSRQRGGSGGRRWALLGQNEEGSYNNEKGIGRQKDKAIGDNL